MRDLGGDQKGNGGSSFIEGFPFYSKTTLDAGAILTILSTHM